MRIHIPPGNYILYKTNYQIEEDDWLAFHGLHVAARLEHATDCDGVICGLVASPEDVPMAHDHIVFSGIPAVVPRYLPVPIGPDNDQAD